MIKLLRQWVNGLGYDVVKLRNSNAVLSTHLTNVFAAKRIDCVLDVGANRGQYGRFLREMGFEGNIVSFEPVASVFEHLQETAKGDPRWRCFNLALGDKVQQRAMNVYDASQFCSFLDTNSYSQQIWGSLDQARPEVVNVARLDDLFPRLLQETGCEHFYLKMDTQGFDRNVFRGAQESLAKIEALQSEVSLIPVYEGMPPTYDVLNEYHARGYFISGMYPINRDASLAVIEYDCVLVKRDSVRAPSPG